MGAIVGGVIGGLAFLGAVGVGAWVFLRRRAARRNHGYAEAGDTNHQDYPKYSPGPVMSENGMQPSQMRLYVSLFILLSGLYFDRHR